MLSEAAATLSSRYAEDWQSDSGVVSLHRSHYLKSSALKQKVRDQQILTSGQAYDSILMQFSLSNSLIITLLPANLISHLSMFRRVHSTSIFTEALAGDKASHRLFFSKTIYSFLFFSLLARARWHTLNTFYIWETDLLSVSCSRFMRKTLNANI